MRNHTRHNPPDETSVYEDESIRAGTSGNKLDGFSNRLRGIKTVESLKIPGYRFYFFSMVGQWGAMSMQMTAQSLLVYRLTGSPALLGIVSLANAIPTLLLSLFGGALADRVSKKAILQIGQLASLVLAAWVAVVLATGYMSPDNQGSWWIILAASILLGIINAFNLPARQAVIPELVSREKVMNAVALNTTGQNILMLVTPAIAGFLIDALGFTSVYCTMTGLYLAAFVFISYIPATPPSVTSVGSPIPRSNPLHDVSEGLKYVWQDITILLILLTVVLNAAFIMSMPNLYPIFTDDIFKVGGTGLGILMSVSGVGALFGSIVLASLPSKKRGMIVLVSSLFQGIALIIFSSSASWFMALGMMVLLGFGRSWHQTAAISLVQNLSETHYLGRVMSLLVMNMGVTSLGTFIAGIVAEKIGAPLSVGTFAMTYILLTLVILIFAPRVRKLD